MQENIQLPEVEVPSFSSFYDDLKASPNNFSFWYPKIKGAFLTPESVIVPVPEEVVRSFFLEREGDRARVEAFVKDTLLPAIPESFGERVFLKNGCTSNKFEFGCCSPMRTVEALSRSLLAISEMAFCVDCGGVTEVVVRRLVGQKDSCFKGTIYEGMRLRPEVRVFYDFGVRKSLYAVNYWDWDYCHDAICDRNADDAKVYEQTYPALKHIFDAQEAYLRGLVEARMKDVDLKGVWSVDLMYAENCWWLVDMAVGQMSAYYDRERVEAAIFALGR